MSPRAGARPHRPGRAPRAVWATVALVGLLLGGCAAPRANLGSSASPCYKALPPAADAVHDRGRLVGVRRLSALRLAHLLGAVPQAGPVRAAGLPGRADQPGRLLCVVAYRGPYGPGQVTSAPPGAAGAYAVVVVAPTGTGPVRAFVLPHLPTRFHHTI